MADKKQNSLAFWIKCVDILGILILVSPWVAMAYITSFFGIYGDDGASVDPTRYMSALINFPLLGFIATQIVVVIMKVVAVYKE